MCTLDNVIGDPLMGRVADDDTKISDGGSQRDRVLALDRVAGRGM